MEQLEQIALNALREHEPPEGYYVCFSGGKDSVVILYLVKRAGVKYEAWHNIMTIEPPELMRFIYKNFPDVYHVHPKQTMHELIIKHGCPPLRYIRYCCWELKTVNGNGRVKVDGIRASESPRRAKRPIFESDGKGGYYLHLIRDWTDEQVWDYIHSRNLPYCELYDQGKRRIGCVFCPFATPAENAENVKRYPGFVKYFVTACDRAIKIRLAKGKYSKYQTGQEMFAAWLTGSRTKSVPTNSIGGLTMNSDSTETAVAKIAIAPAVKHAKFVVGKSYAVSSTVPCPAPRVIITHRYDEQSRSNQIEWRFPYGDNTSVQIANLDFLSGVEVIYLRIGYGNFNPIARADSPAVVDSGSVVSFVPGKVYDIIAPKNFRHKRATVVSRDGSQITWHFADGFDPTEHFATVYSDSCAEFFKDFVDNANLIVRADCLNLELNRPAEADTNKVTPVDIPAVTEQPTIEQLTVEVKFYLGQIGQNIIEVGKRLIQAKELLPHGEWQNWLEKNFELSMQTARKFMQVYERFGITRIDTRFGDTRFSSTQMIAMLALPADETEQFIEAKAVEGTPVEDMTVKKLREEIQQWKTKANENAAALDNANKITADANAQIARYQSVVESISASQTALQHDNEELQRELAAAQKDAQDTKLELQNRPIEVEVPADYYDNQKELAAKDAKIAQLQRELDSHATTEDYATVAKKLDDIYSLIIDISNFKNVSKVVADYKHNNPDRYHLLCAKLSHFIRVVEMN